MSQPNWEADKMLDVYIYDYLMKRKLHASAKAFQAEGKVSADPVAIDAPGGFLFEWWSVFWDIFITRTDEKHSEAAASYNETQELLQQQQWQQQQQHQHQKPQQHQQMQMQQLFLQRHAHQQQQPRDGNQLPNGNVNGLVSSDTLMRRNPATANAAATKMYEQRLKGPLQRDALDDGAVKQRLGDNVGQLLDPNHASMLKAAAVGGQHPGQTLHGNPGVNSGNLQQVPNRSQQLPGHMQDIKSEMNSMMNPVTAGPDGTSIEVQGID